MPANFPEMWVNRVEYNLTTADNAPWLDGITEIDTAIIEVGSGSAGEQNLIHIPTTEFEVDILINNTAYPIAVQQYSDDGVTLQLDKYQTKVVPISDDQATGASYKRIDAVTFLMTRGMLITKYKKAIHSIAPAGNTDKTPILKTTGRSGKFDANGDEIILRDGDRLILVYEDLVDHKKQYDLMEVPEVGRRLVLCSDHWNDLLLDRKRFGDLLVNYTKGSTVPMIAGFELYQYIGNPSYNGDTLAKLAYGSVPGDHQYKASVSFYTPNIAKKTGYTRQYFLPAPLNPANQSNDLAYRHYFMAVPKQAKYIGAIVSTYSPAAA
ncbi:hypothetical protein J3L18_23195 [Mucilaginibacter gossypii]|uniref:hypothetical protein n=1 Tax=Mucilaginibacter gossypii TaxID=551996 RepID=UPI000DCE8C7B|nr:MULTISPECIES: hypothetical protein [Mucilaginibacter]QTE36021.1 hypothetical protein J3L18_23195 [Mucilaginibacter gossypii]RAV56695.1 hypothetical protein DIU36_14940 [Mucilaginibacter rubeus]